MEQASATTQRLETGGLRIVASTDRKDRDGRIVHQDGWELEPYKSNPVLMFDHGYLDPNGHKLPVGRVGSIDVADGRLMAGDITWAKDPFSQMVREMYEPSDGSPPIMQAASAGWLPLEPPVQRDDGEHHTRQELAELSLTPIPSNRDTTAFIAATFRGLMHHSSATVETAESPQPQPAPDPVPPAVVSPGTTEGEEPPSPGADAGEGVASPDSSPESVSAPSPGVDEALADEVRQLMNRNQTPAPEPEAVEANDGEGSAPAPEQEAASGLQTRHEHAKRVAEVTAQVTERVLQRLTGRLPD